MAENYTTKTCAFCKGVGKDPFGVLSKLSDCQVCLGKGKVSVSAPVEQCPSCGGNGIFIHHRLPCSVCRGKGFVAKLKGVERCKDCSGKGVESESGLPCLSCYGLRGLRVR